MIRAATRRLLGLPPRRCRSALERCWVPMRDGVRLASWHVWPIDVEGEAPTVVIRTPYGMGGRRSPTVLMARLIAESGYHVLVQDVRGRYASEGEFVPFVAERADGADTLAWLGDQHWSNGPVGLFGPSYLAYTAWCALGEAPERVGAIASVVGSGDVYGLFYRGGAFSLANALEWGCGVGERENVPPRRIDLERGLAHRPVREADRVALRTVDWVRDWLDHTRRDDYWHALHPPLPSAPPPVLSIAGWYDFFLECQLRDHAALERAVAERGGVRPRLVVGPWAHGVPARLGYWRHGMAGHALRETIAHFDVHLRGEKPDEPPAAVRFYLPGAETWESATSWPPEGASETTLHLAPSATRPDYEHGTVRFDAAPADAPARSFGDDPEDPTPTLGGALFGLKAGIKDQRPLELRDDVLVYDSDPLESDLVLAGDARLTLHVEADARDFDVAAKLIDVAPNGRADNVADGIQRARWCGVAEHDDAPRFAEPGEVQRIDVSLGGVARRLATGHRLRVLIAGANFPRFDRNPGSDALPAEAGPDAFTARRLTVHHDASRPATLDVRILGGR